MSAVKTLFESLVQKLRHSSGLGEVKMTDDSKDTQEAQITGYGGFARDRARRYETYGISIRPLKGAGVLWQFVGWISGHVAILAYPEPRYRKKNLQEGEVCLYTDEGDYILLSRGRIIKVVAGTEIDVTAPTVVVTASTKIKLDSPAIEFTGDVTIDKTLTVSKAVTFNGGGSFNTGNFTVGAAAQLLVITPGTLKVAGVAVVAP